MSKLISRKISLDTENIPKYWAAGLVYPTHFLNSISLSFPLMEKMAVVTMKAAAKEIEDDKIKSDLKAFCDQENNHSAAHNAFNRMALKGYDTPEALGGLTTWCKEVGKRSIKERVCIVIAFEYFTGSCARLLMKSLDKALENKKIHPEAYKLWYWHCAEEIEHHAVGWELVEPFGIKKEELNAAVREYFYIFYPYLLSCTKELVKADKRHLQPKTWLGASVFLGRHVQRMLPYFLNFFTPSFNKDTYKEVDAELMKDFLASGIEYEI